MFGGCYSNYYDGGGYGRGGYDGSTFVLIVVLFILLIIVGCSFI
ncbi:YjcZ family sporulation protein [Sporosarcina sp. USHLN248]